MLSDVFARCFCLVGLLCRMVEKAYLLVLFSLRLFCLIMVPGYKETSTMEINFTCVSDKIIEYGNNSMHVYSAGSDRTR